MTHAAGMEFSKENPRWSCPHCQGNASRFGWLIESAGREYYQIPRQAGDGPWTADSEAALRFSRKQDAEAFAGAILQSHAGDFQIVEHGWG